MSRAVTAPSARPPAIAGAFTGVLFATARADDGRPAAAMPWGEETLVGRLSAQLSDLGAGELHLVVRPGDEGGLAAPAGARVHVCEDAAEDLRLVATLAREGEGALVLAGAEIITQREALAGLLADPRLATGILATSGRIARPYGFRTKSRRGRIVSASSPFHITADPNQTFLGVLKVSPADRPRLAVLAERVAQLRAAAPDGWTQELDFCKAGTWKLAAERIARAVAARDARLAAEAQGLPFDPQAAAAPDPEAEENPEASDEPPAAIERQNPDTVELSPADAAEHELRLAAAAEEVPALLLTALVRDGGQVGNSFLRSLFWARPLSGDAVAAARERISMHDEGEELLRSSVKGSDGFFTTFFVSPLSKYVARWLGGTGATPNQVSAFSMLVGIAAAVAFATGERAGFVGGALLAYLAFFFDCVDGQLARYTRTFSKFGAWLDSILDRSKEYVIFAGLALGASKTGDSAWVLACAALTLQTTRHAIDFAYPTTQHLHIAAVQHAAIEAPGDGFGLNTPLWLRPPPLPPEQRPPAPRPTLKGRVWRLWRRVGRVRGAVWVKKAITFPIGERFAVMALVTAIFSPRATLIVLLSWGGFAMTYIILGRLIRVVRSETAVAPPGTPRGRLEAFRDDGPLLVRRALPFAPLALIGPALLVLLGAIVLGAGEAVAAVVVALAVVAGVATSGTPHHDRLRWLVPAALRVIEFGGITWLATLDSPGAVPAAFALLAAIAFREYDLVYRLRHRGTEAERWVAALGLGWGGRLLVALVLLLAGALPAGFYVFAALLGVLFAGDAVRAWTSFGRAARAPVYSDEEEGEE